jgi:hypothetical protein
LFLIRCVLLFYAAVAIAGIAAFWPRESGALAIIGAMWLVIRRSTSKDSLPVQTERKMPTLWGME